jgi:hypothetical protein
VPEESGVSPHRLVGSFAFAIIVMFVTFATGFGIAESGAWGGEHSFPYWSVMLLGHGIPLAVAQLLNLGRRLSLIAEAAQFSLLAALFYSVATRWSSGSWVGLRNRRVAPLLAVALGTPILLAAVVTMASRRPVKIVMAYQGSDGKWHNETARVIPPVPASAIPVFGSAAYDGKVVMKALINQEGKVEDLRMDNLWALDHGWPRKLRGLDVDTVQAAARNWTYKPATLQGQPVPVFLRVVVRYRPAPHYVIKVRPSASRVELECVSGCRWITLSMGCGKPPCEFLVDEAGMK